MIIIRVNGTHYVSAFNSFGVVAFKDKSRAYDFETMEKALKFSNRIGSREFKKIEILKIESVVESLKRLKF